MTPPAPNAHWGRSDAIRPSSMVTRRSQRCAHPRERETKHHHQEDYRSPPHRAQSSRAGVPEHGLLWWSAWGRLACTGLVVWVPQWASTMGLVWLQ